MFRNPKRHNPGKNFPATSRAVRYRRGSPVVARSGDTPSQPRGKAQLRQTAIHHRLSKANWINPCTPLSLPADVGPIQALATILSRVGENTTTERSGSANFAMKFANILRISEFSQFNRPRVSPRLRESTTFRAGSENSFPLRSEVPGCRSESFRPGSNAEPPAGVPPQGIFAGGVTAIARN